MCRNQDVRVEVLAKIYLALQCDFDEIMEIIPKNNGKVQ